MTRLYATSTGWLNLSTGLMVDGTAPPPDPDPPTGLTGVYGTAVYGTNTYA